MAAHDATREGAMEPLTLEQQKAIALASARARAAQAQDQRSPFPQSAMVDRPEQNWSNIRANSADDAGIRKQFTDRELTGARLLSAIPFNMGSELVAGIGTLAGEKYGDVYNRVNDVEKRYSSERPWEQFALSLPMNIAASAAIPLSPIPQAAIAGGLTGAGSDGTVGERALYGVGGAALGAGTGLLLKGAGNYLEKKFMPPERQAANYLRNLVESAGKTTDDIIPPASGKPFTPAEVIGENAKAHAMALSRQNGATPDLATAVIFQRGADRASRIAADFTDAIGINPSDAKELIDKVVSDGRDRATPLYEAAFARPNTAIWSQRLQDFLDQPEAMKGLNLGLKIQRLESVAKGVPFNPADYSVKGIEADGTPIIGWSKAGTLARGGDVANGQFDIPNLRALDAVKRGLDSMIEDYRDKTTGRLVLDETGRALNKFRAEFIKALDNVAPKEYAAARAMAGDYLSANSAFERGGKSIFNNNVTEKQFANMFNALEDHEKMAMRGGIANKVFDTLQSGRTSVKQFMSPRSQEKMAIAFGKEKAASLISNLMDEAKLAEFEGLAAPKGNSITARVSQAMAEQKGLAENPQNAAIYALGSAITNPRGFLRQMWEGASNKVMDAAKVGGLSEQARNISGDMLYNFGPDSFAKTLQGYAQTPRGYIGSLGNALVLSPKYGIAGLPPLLLAQRSTSSN